MSDRPPASHSPILPVARSSSGNWQLAMLLPAQLRDRGASAALVGALVLAGALIIRAATLKSKTPRNKDGEPLPRPASTLPFLGNTLDLLRNSPRLHDWIMETTLSFGGKPWLLQALGQPQMVVLTTPEANEDIQHRLIDKFSKGKLLHEIIYDIGGNVMVFIDGELWAYQRKTAARLFSSRAIREHMAEIVNKHVIVLDDVLGEAAGAGKVVDIAELLLHLTMETICEIAFGLDIKSLKSDSVHPFEEAVDEGQHIAISRADVPTFIWKFQRLLGIGKEGRLKECVAVVNDTVMTIIKETMAKIQEEKQSGTQVSGKRKDALSLFLESEDADERLTPDLLRDITLSLIVGGRDTTADSIGWVFYHIAQHPDMEQKIREEIIATFGEHLDVNENPSYEKLQKMTYLEATIKETLRLQPPASWNLRFTEEDVVMSDGTFIPQGSYAVFAPYTTGRRTDVWGEDAAEFKPERWVDPANPTRLIQVSNFKFNAFLAGPRQCIGMNFALMEMKVIIVKIMSRFHLDMEPGQNVKYRRSVTLPLDGGLKVRVRRV